jgi:hypothetical protein
VLSVRPPVTRCGRVGKPRPQHGPPEGGTLTPVVRLISLVCALDDGPGFPDAPLMLNLSACSVVGCTNCGWMGPVRHRRCNLFLPSGTRTHKSPRVKRVHHKPARRSLRSAGSKPPIRSPLNGDQMFEAALHSGLPRTSGDAERHSETATLQRARRSDLLSRSVSPQRCQIAVTQSNECQLRVSSRLLLMK